MLILLQLQPLSISTNLLTCCQSQSFIKLQEAGEFPKVSWAASSPLSPSVYAESQSPRTSERDFTWRWGSLKRNLRPKEVLRVGPNPAGWVSFRKRAGCRHPQKCTHVRTWGGDSRLHAQEKRDWEGPALPTPGSPNPASSAGRQFCGCSSVCALCYDSPRKLRHPPPSLGFLPGCSACRAYVSHII